MTCQVGYWLPDCCPQRVTPGAAHAKRGINEAQSFYRNIGRKPSAGVGCCARNPA